MLASIRKALKPEGVLLVVEFLNQDSHAANVLGNPAAEVFYGCSVMFCLNSGLSTPGGAGLGTLGVTLPLLQEFGATAGFASTERVPFAELPFQACYLLRAEGRGTAML